VPAKFRQSAFSQENPLDRAVVEITDEAGNIVDLVPFVVAMTPDRITVRD
jgi:hypothetical protein